jgi:hypothetical protein
MGNETSNLNRGRPQRPNPSNKKPPIRRQQKFYNKPKRPNNLSTPKRSHYGQLPSLHQQYQQQQSQYQHQQPQQQRPQQQRQYYSQVQQPQYVQQQQYQPQQPQYVQQQPQQPQQQIRQPPIQSTQQYVNNQVEHLQQRQNQQLTRQFDFGNLNILNVNDKIKDFEDEQERRQREFEEEQQQRRKLFDKEITMFERGQDDPYKILGLHPNNISTQQIKKAYRINAQRHHPDKGGNPAIFKKVTQSYCYLMNKHGQDDEIKYKTTRDVTQQTYEPDSITKGYQSVHVSKDNFNVNQFNEIFEKHRLDDNPYSSGYGDMMTKDPRTDESVDVGRSIFDNDQFNIDIFNDTFKDESKDDELIVYQEPEALPSTTGDYQELGQSNITDFGKSSQFTDYKRAYSKDNRFIDPDKVEYKQYKNVGELKAARANVSHQMSAEDERRLREKERREQEAEEMRQRRVAEQDNKYLEHFEKLNQIFLKD